MKLLANGWSTAETTLAGTTAGAGGASSAGGTYGTGKQLRVQKIVAFTGGSTVAPNTSGGLHFRYGDSSDNIRSTFVVLPMGGGGALTSAAAVPQFSITLDDLNIQCNWFEAASQEGAAGGWGIFVMGE